MGLKFTTQIDNGDYAPKVNYGAVLRTPSVPAPDLPDVNVAPFNIDLTPIGDAMIAGAEAESKARIASAEASLKIAEKMKADEEDAYKQRQQQLYNCFSRKALDIEQALASGAISPKEAELRSRGLQDQFISNYGLEPQLASKGFTDFMSTGHNIMNNERKNSQELEMKSIEATQNAIAAIDPSFNLLSPDEKMSFTRTAMQRTNDVNLSTKANATDYEKNRGDLALSGLISEKIKSSILNGETTKLFSAGGEAEMDEQILSALISTFPEQDPATLNRLYKIEKARSGYSILKKEYQRQKSDELTEQKNNVELSNLELKRKIQSNPITNFWYNGLESQDRTNARAYGDIDDEVAKALSPSIKANADGTFTLRLPTGETQVVTAKDAEDATHMMLQTMENPIASSVDRAWASSGLVGMHKANLHKTDQNSADIDQNIKNTQVLLETIPEGKDRDELKNAAASYIAVKNIQGGHPYAINELNNAAELVRSGTYTNYIRYDPEAGKLGITAEGKYTLGRILGAADSIHERENLEYLNTVAEKLPKEQRRYFFEYLIGSGLEDKKPDEVLNNLSVLEYAAGYFSKTLGEITPIMDQMTDESNNGFKIFAQLIKERGLSGAIDYISEGLSNRMEETQGGMITKEVAKETVDTVKTVATKSTGAVEKGAEKLLTSTMKSDPVFADDMEKIYDTLTDLPKTKEPARLSKINAPFFNKDQVQPGNIDVAKRVKVENPDGTYSTLRSITVGIQNKEGKEFYVLIPTLSDLGEPLTDEEAKEQFKRTGGHLGIFTTLEAANKAAKEISKHQEDIYE